MFFAKPAGSQMNAPGFPHGGVTPSSLDGSKEASLAGEAAQPTNLLPCLRNRYGFARTVPPVSIARRATPAATAAPILPPAAMKKSGAI